LQIIREELTALPSAFASLVAAKPVAAGAVAVAPFRVRADPITSFPISLKVIADSNNDRIASILVTEIPADSLTERAGVKAGDEILSLDDRAVRTFAQGVGRRSELGSVLIDRPPGTRLTLEILSPGDSAPRRVTIESAQPTGGFRWW
jgi:S1-C subfamily serine protease